MQKQMSKRFLGVNLNVVLLIIGSMLAGAVLTAAIAILVSDSNTSEGSVPSSVQARPDVERQGEGRIAEFEQFSAPTVGSLNNGGAIDDSQPSLGLESFYAPSSGNWLTEGEIAGAVDELAVEPFSAPSSGDWLFEGQVAGAVDEFPSVRTPATQSYPDVLFQEQNLWLPGDVGDADQAVLTTEEIRLLEQNLWLPEATDPVSQPQVGFTDY